jgi:[acyl-carrier-protein] S-malonyltransferase
VKSGDIRRLFAYRASGLGHPVRWVLRHGLFSDPGAAGAADARALPLMGAAAAQELPASLAGALEGCKPGDTVGPLRDGLGWHLAYVEDVLPAAQADYADVAPALRAELLAAARRRAFAHWLDRRRAELLTCVPGLEHPGDPSQPDNHHRH